MATIGHVTRQPIGVFEDGLVNRQLNLGQSRMVQLDVLGYYYYDLFASINAYKINKHINIVCL